MVSLNFGTNRYDPTTIEVWMSSRTNDGGRQLVPCRHGLHPHPLSPFIDPLFPARVCCFLVLEPERAHPVGGAWVAWVQVCRRGSGAGTCVSMVGTHRRRRVVMSIYPSFVVFELKAARVCVHACGE